MPPLQSVAQYGVWAERICDVYSGTRFLPSSTKHLTISGKDECKSKAVSINKLKNAFKFVKMSSDSETEQTNYGNESLASFEEEIEGLAGAVGAAAIDDEAEIDRPYMGEPLADENWLRNYRHRREEERQRNEVLVRRLNGTLPVESW